MLLRIVRSLVQGMGTQAVQGDPNEYAHFRQTVDEISTALTEGLEAGEYLFQTDLLLKALEDYNGRTSRVIRQAGSEYQAMVRMLTSTAAAIATASQENVQRLVEIETRVAIATKIEDVCSIKAALSECLVQIREESTRQRTISEETQEQLKRSIREVQSSAAAPMNVNNDSVTELPARALAETALAQASHPETPIYVAVMVIDRLQSYNATYGREAGDNVLCFFARFVRRKLRANDQAFRWSGPALLALVSRTEGIESARVEFRGLMEQGLQYTLRKDGRTVRLPIAPRWTVLPMMAAPHLLYQKIDAFAALPG